MEISKETYEEKCVGREVVMHQTPIVMSRLHLEI